MQALVFIVQTLFGLYQAVLLLRLLLQLGRADFRNPLAQAIVKLTDPVIRPLRRALPAMGRVDTASVVAILLAIAVEIAVVRLLLGVGMPGSSLLLRDLATYLVELVLKTYLVCIILYAVLSFASPDHRTPAQSMLASVCEPLLAPVRRRIPSIAGLDLSPLWVCIAIQALLILLR
jgi:YggT family protein